MDGLVLVPVTVLTVLVFGAVIRRLLGVRLGLVRTLLAAGLALVVAEPLIRALVPDPEAADPAAALLAALLAVAVASLLAMALLVIAEVVVPDGSLPGPVELWRGGRARAARARRYGQVLRIALRHGLGRFLRGRWHPGASSPAARRELARSLRRALDEGGVTFVKLGQQLSTRRDLVPAEFADELTGLQDRAAPVAWADVRDVLAGELGRPVEDVFAAVDPEPLAAASVAQVHAARLPDGTEVVVKVQRPGVAAVVERDLDILLHLARTLEVRTRWGRSLGVVPLAAGFATALREELDFTVERDNLRGMAAAVADAPAIRVPAPYPELSTGRVLVMERMDGVPLGAAGPALAGRGPAERTRLATALLETVFDQVLERGLVHVDLHPGNVLLQDDGTLALLDLGSVARVDGGTRAAMGRLLAAVGSADSRTASDALLELVDRPETIDERELERALGGLIVRYTAPGVTMGAAVFTALFRLVTTHGLAVPPQVAAVFRALATLEGTLTVLDPGFDLVARARDAGRGRLAQAVTPARLRETAEEELVALLPLLRRLPRRVDRIADAAEHGRLAVTVRLFADGRDRRWITDLVHQALLTVLGAAAGLMAVLLLGATGGPEITETVRLFPVVGYGLLVVSAVLALRVLVVVFRHDRG